MQKNKRHYGWIILLVIIAIILLFSLLKLYNQHEFDRRLDELAAEGHPISLDDLEAAYVLPEGTENTADIYLEAVYAYHSPTTKEDKLLPLPFEHIVDRRMIQGTLVLSEETMDTLKLHLERNQDSLDLLDLAAAKKHCLLPLQRNGTLLTLDSIHYGNVLDLLKLVCYRNLYYCQKKETTELFESFQTLVALTSLLDKSPFWNEYGALMGSKNAAAANLNEILNQMSFSKPQLKTLQEQFSGMLQPDILTNHIISERCSMIEFFKLPFNMQKKRPYLESSDPVLYLHSISGLQEKEALLLLDYFEQCLDASKLPSHERIEAFRRIDSEKSKKTRFHAYFRDMARSYQGVNECSIWIEANLQCAQTALAIERYRLKYQSLPESLDILIPEFIGTIPADPFDGNPLRYIRHDVGYTVYSIDKDGVDNGGLNRHRIIEKTRNPPREYDTTFTVRR